MVAKGSSISHTAASIEYGKNQKEVLVEPLTGDEYKGELASKEIDRNLIFGDTAHEIAGDFQMFHRGSRVKNNMFSFVVSPTKEVSSNFTVADWRILTQDFLKKMGNLLGVANLEENQAYIAYLHTGSKSKTKHLHVYMNRILPNNKPIKDSWVGKKASVAAEQIAIERGYKTAKQIRLENEKLKNMEPEAKFIKQSITNVLANYPKNLNDFINQLEQYQILSVKKYDSNKKLRGLSFSYKKKTYKATIFQRNLSGNKIQQTIAKLSKSNKSIYTRNKKQRINNKYRKDLNYEKE